MVLVILNGLVGVVREVKWSRYIFYTAGQVVNVYELEGSRDTKGSGYTGMMINVHFTVTQM